MTDVDEFTELVDGNFARVDLVGKSANGISTFLIAKSADDQDGSRGILEQSLVAELVAKATHNEQEPAVSAVAKADPDLDAGGDLLVGDDAFATPGSAAWEKVDADTASKWVGILARAKNAVLALLDREGVELASTGDAGDMSAAWDLEDTICALECAIDGLAPFAVAEAAEADRQSEMSGVAKSALALDADSFPLTTIESLMPVLKAGRVLSSGNEAKIRTAVDSLQQVLSSLPAAPEGTIMKSAQELVAKAEATPPVPGTTQADMIAGKTGQTSPNGNSEAISANAGNPVEPSTSSLTIPGDVKTLTGLADSQSDTTGDSGSQTPPVPGTTQADMLGGVTGQSSPNANPQQPQGNVSKGADADPVVKAAPQQAVYNAAGKLLGTVDPAKITELVDEGSAEAASTPEAGGEADAPAAEPAPDSPATDAPPADMEPAPAGAVGTPASEEVAKSELAEVVKAAVTEATAELAEVVKAQKDRIDVLEAPARTRVLSNGALPPTNQLRGMDQSNGTVVDVAKAAELREQFDNAVAAPEREAIAKAMNEAAGDAFAQLRATQGMPIAQ